MEILQTKRNKVEFLEIIQKKYICNMETPDEIAAKRIKKYRESLNLTQKDFAELLEIKNNIADIERGRTKISGYVLVQLIKKCELNPLWLYGNSPFKNINQLQTNVSPKTITLNSEKKENMVLVDVKASAGYATNIQEPNWFNELPAFDFPLPEYRNATFRGFQVQGDSMLPSIKPKEWVIARAIDNFKDLGNLKICVVVLKDSVLVKQLHKSEDIRKTILISLNKIYPPIEVLTDEIQEVWEVTSKLSFDINTIGETASIHDLQLAMQRLSNEITELKNKV